MTLEHFVALAEKWNNLGSAIQEQACAVLDDSDKFAEQNPNALKAFRRFLKEVTRDCDDAQLKREAKDQIDMLDEHLEEYKPDFDTRDREGR